MARSSGRKKEPGVFKTFAEMREVLDKHTTEIEERLPVPPYYREVHIEQDGSLSFGEYREMILAPEEAVRLARWIIQFYGGGPG